MTDKVHIDKTVVDFASTMPENHDGLWVDTVRPLYAVSPLENHSLTNPRLGRSWLLDQLVLSESVFPNQLLHRGQSHVRGFSDVLWLGVLSRGEIKGSLDGEQVHIRPGEIQILDFTRVYSAKCSPAHLRSLMIAHEAIGYDPSRHPPIIRICESTVMGKVLLRTLMSVFAQLDNTTRAEAPSMARGLIALLKSILFAEPGTEPVSPSFTAARVGAMRSYIEQNLHSGSLDPEAIGARFQVSRSTLYRDFKEEGGVERFIRARRLDAALTALAFGPVERGAVSRAAKQCGFTATPHFSREFRRRFGISPSDVVGQRHNFKAGEWSGRSAEDVAASGDFGSFLRRL